MDRGNVVDAYCSAWDEADAVRREAILKTSGVAELVEHIGRALGRYPGSRIVRTSAVDAHHSVARFGWKKILADGSSLPEGVDFVEFSAAGAIQRVVGFFGPLPS
jgi:hypothetical protein